MHDKHWIHSNFNAFKTAFHRNLKLNKLYTARPYIPFHFFLHKISFLAQIIPKLQIQETQLTLAI